LRDCCRQADTRKFAVAVSLRSCLQPPRLQVLLPASFCIPGCSFLQADATRGSSSVPLLSPPPGFIATTDSPLVPQLADLTRLDTLHLDVVFSFEDWQLQPAYPIPAAWFAAGGFPALRR
jgi:hypothetical protein